jgi:membrane protease YdiL (CAAX protease family)
MSERTVVRFYVLAFGIAWLGWIPAALGSRSIAPFDAPHFQFLLILPAIAPALAAVIVMRATYGVVASNELFKALVRWQVSPAWYLVAVLGPLVLLVAGRTVTDVLRLTDVPPAPQGEPIALAIVALITSLLANPWEEVGWRGFALPHWQQRFTALTASLILGGLWGLWHVPLFFWVGNPMATYPFGLWFLSLLALTVLYTWLYNATAGNLFVVTLFHVGLNTFGAAVQGISWLSLVLVYSLVALILLVRFGPIHLSPQPRTQAG